jgi:anti-anti-sigma regulatory factor
MLAQTSVIDAYHEATARGGKSIVVNFARVASMNSAGIAQLFTIVGEAHRSDQRLAFVGLVAHHQKVLTLMGFTRFVGMYPSAEEAYAAVASPD